MFVYGSLNELKVTFSDNKPVEKPEYVIKVDEAAKTIKVVGETATETTVDVSEYKKQIDTLTATIQEQEKTITDLQAELEQLKSAE